MSKYDSIETAADLIVEVANNGLSTVQEDLNRAADIFGRTSIEELDRLANDIGRNNENGEPDPDGSWSSSRKATQDTFYFIAFSIWNWREATAFFNEHTNPATKGRRIAKLEEQINELTEEAEGLTNTMAAADETILEQKNEIAGLERECEEYRRTITELKAKLYDALVEGGVRA